MERFPNLFYLIEIGWLKIEFLIVIWITFYWSFFPFFLFILIFFWLMLISSAFFSIFLAFFLLICVRWGEKLVNPNKKEEQWKWATNDHKFSWKDKMLFNWKVLGRCSKIVDRFFKIWSFSFTPPRSFYWNHQIFNDFFYF